MCTDARVYGFSAHTSSQGISSVLHPIQHPHWYSQLSSLQCMPTESCTIILPFLHIVHLHHDTVPLGPPPELLLQLVLHPGFLSSHPHGLFHSLPLSQWLPRLFTLNSYLVLCSPRSVLTFIPDSHLPHIRCSPTAF